VSDGGNDGVGDDINGEGDNDVSDGDVGDDVDVNGGHDA